MSALPQSVASDYFDTLHSILLSHIRRGNSASVLLILSLPHVYSHPLFWQTCTYREGLVAAVLGASVDGGNGETQRMLDVTQPLEAVPSSVVGSVVPLEEDGTLRGEMHSSSGGEATAALPELTLPELYLMLRGCTSGPHPRDIHGSCTDVNTRSPLPGEQTTTEHNGSIPAEIAVQSSLWLSRLLHRMEEPPLPPRGDATNTLPSGTHDNCPLPDDENVMELMKHPQRPPITGEDRDVDLAFLSTLLQAHCYGIVRYANPLLTAAARDTRGDDGKEEGTSTVMTASTVCSEKVPLGQPELPRSDASGCHAGRSNTFAFQSRKRPRVEGGNGEEGPVAGGGPLLSAVDALSRLETACCSGEDAVAVLTKINPLPGTTQVADSFAGVLPPQRSADMAEVPAVAPTAIRRPIASLPGGAEERSTSFGVDNGEMGSTGGEGSREESSTSEAQSSTVAATSSPGDRIAKAIRVFDAYYETSAAPSLVGRPSTTGADAAPIRRRRKKFTPMEDAAIVQGIARFGGHGSGRFEYIYRAYQSVWQPGRRPIHLYDHWRDALRKRAVLCPQVAAALEALPGIELHATEESSHPPFHQLSGNGRSPSAVVVTQVCRPLLSSSSSPTVASVASRPLPVGLRRRTAVSQESNHSEIEDYEDTPP